MKKRLFTLLSILGVIFQLQAQAQSSFSINEPFVQDTMEVSPSDFKVMNAGIKNLTATDVYIAFNLVSVNAPEGWVFSLCGPQNCYTPQSSIKGVEKLKVSDNYQIFEINYKPKSAGVGEVVYEVYDKALPELKQQIKFRLTATVTTSVVEQTIASSLNLFPNPCTEFANINFQAEFNEPILVTLCDGMGRIIYKNQQTKIGNTNIVIPMNFYPQGIYHLSIKNAQNEIITSRKLIKN